MNYKIGFLVHINLNPLGINSTHNFFEDFDDALSNFGLEQLIDFVTWSRLVNNVYKSSVLDHVYVNDGTSVTNIQSINQTDLWRSLAGIF